VTRPSVATFDAATPETAAAAGNVFGFELYGRIARGGGNIVFSPLDAAVALSTAMYGARGETQTEILRVLHIEPDAADWANASFGRLIADLNARDGKHGLTVRVANRAWAQEGLVIHPEFLSMLKNRYGASVGQVDFRTSGPACDEINRWVARATNGRIEQIVEPQNIKGDTRLVLASALYFKGLWEHRFDPRETRDGDFAAPTGNVRGRFMWTRGEFNYARADGAQILELPFAGNLSMIVVLPDAPDRLSTLEQKLELDFDGWLKKLVKTQVEIHLPRWTGVSALTMEGALQQMGMRLAFETGADLSRITDARPLYIAKILQRAFIDVNEDGSEAAAASATLYETVADEPKTTFVRFRADHVFLYAIRDSRTRAVLFFGRVADPGRR